MNIEVCCSSVYSVQIAEKLGASRVELCQNLLQDGLTPSLELQQEVCESYAIPIHVLIRPRVGDCFYSTSDLKRIDEAIHHALKFPIAGIVVGHMNRKKGVDPALLRHWRTVTQGLALTFHRAFDQVSKPFNVLEDLVEAGFNRILSSGQQPTAALGIDLLRDLQQVAGTSLQVMPGGGITDPNAPFFLAAGLNSIHFSAKSATHHAHLDHIIVSTILNNVITLSLIC